MLRPVNNHLLIEPLKYESFVAVDKQTYEQIGIVVECSEELIEKVRQGQKVYFDSWLAAKYPAKEEGKWYWLVKWDDVRMVETDD